MDAQKQIIQPQAQKTPQSSVHVFSMPARYRHGAHVQNVEPTTHQAHASVAASVTPPPTPRPPQPVAPPPIGTKKSTSHTTRGLLIAAVIVLIALLIGGYMLLRSVQKNRSVPTQTESTTSQTPETETAAKPVEAPKEETPVVPTTPFPTAATPGVDTDSDGLTNTEEELVYGTNASLPDSDSDGFLDGNEVFHRYNPNGTAPGTLLGAGLVQILEADAFRLSYPTKWVVLPSQTNGYEISASTGEKILISKTAKTAEQTLQDWYTTLLKNEVPTASKTKNGFTVLVAKNQLTSYVDLGTTVLTVFYDTGIKPTIDYLQTYQMVINSIEKK
jgi:hypothetical protein